MEVPGRPGASKTTPQQVHTGMHMQDTSHAQRKSSRCPRAHSHVGPALIPVAARIPLNASHRRLQVTTLRTKTLHWMPQPGQDPCHACPCLAHAQLPLAVAAAGAAAGPSAATAFVPTVVTTVTGPSAAAGPTPCDVRRRASAAAPPSNRPAAAAARADSTAAANTLTFSASATTTTSLAAAAADPAASLLPNLAASVTAASVTFATASLPVTIAPLASAAAPAPGSCTTPARRAAATTAAARLLLLLLTCPITLTPSASATRPRDRDRLFPPRLPAALVRSVLPRRLRFHTTSALAATLFGLLLLWLNEPAHHQRLVGDPQVRLLALGGGGGRVLEGLLGSSARGDAAGLRLERQLVDANLRRL